MSVDLFTELISLLIEFFRSICSIWNYGRSSVMQNVLLISGMVVNGFVNVVITTIERRFGLRSSQSGLVAGGYDIASFACLIPVTYLGGRPGASKPRWLGWGVLLMGIGSLVFTVPHFAVGPYRGATHHSSTCQIFTNTSTNTVSIKSWSPVHFRASLLTFSVITSVKPFASSCVLNYLLICLSIYLTFTYLFA